MKRYLITKNNTQQGPYTEEQIINMILSSQLQRNDLCWCEGMSQWAPISSVISLPPTLPTAPSPIPPPPPPAESSIPPPPFAQSGIVQSEQLFYIPIERLAVMSIVTGGCFGDYWMYKNWCYLKKRDNLNISPFWRAIFGWFFINELLVEIKRTTSSNHLEKSDFAPTPLAVGWIIFTISAIILSLLSGIFIETMLVAELILVNSLAIAFSSFSYIFLLPAQRIVNKANESALIKPQHAPWSLGHNVVLIVGAASMLYSLYELINP